MNDKVNKALVVRFPEKLHRDVKLQAFKEGKTIQEWVFAVLIERLKSSERTCSWLCQECGGWTLKGTQMAMLGKCEYCTKDDIAVFPCMEKK